MLHHGSFLRRIRAGALSALLAAGVFASAQVPTRISSEAPIVNFRLPSFTPEGNRASMVRGSEARVHSSNVIEVKDLNMTVFVGDATERIETIILSPAATLRPDAQTIGGESTIRVINDEFEATGENWHYEHQEKRVSITKNVRVAFRAQLKNLLQ